MTVAVSVIVTLSVVSLAVYVTDWAVASLTVKVTTPLAFETPLAAEIVETPEPAVNVTVLFGTGFEFTSSRVTVTVDVVTPLAGTVGRLGLTEESGLFGKP